MHEKASFLQVSEIERKSVCVHIYGIYIDIDKDKDILYTNKWTKIISK